MDARASKLKHFYGISAADAKDLVGRGLDSPRKVKAGKSKLPKRLRDKVKR